MTGVARDGSAVVGSGFDGAIAGPRVNAGVPVPLHFGGDGLKGASRDPGVSGAAPARWGRIADLRDPLSRRCAAMGSRHRGNARPRPQGRDVP